MGCAKVNKRGGTIPNVGGKKHPLKPYKFPKALPTGLNDLDQKEAKTYLPPDSFIWRGNIKGAWFCTVGAHKDHAEPWSKHGMDSSVAMWACIRFAWLQWLDDHSLPKEHCPIAGLL